MLTVTAESSHWKPWPLSASPSRIMDEAPKRVKKEGWTPVRKSLNMTIRYVPQAPCLLPLTFQQALDLERVPGRRLGPQIRAKIRESAKGRHRAHVGCQNVEGCFQRQQRSNI
jgi:hypothetical protein